MTRAVLLMALTLGLAACGGGGGGGGSHDEPLTLSLATQSLMFTAQNPFATTPSVQTVSASVTGTASGGTLFVIVRVTGDAVTNVSGVTMTTANSGQATVTPTAPTVLGSGTFTSNIEVSACLDSPTCATGHIRGSPRTIPVTYTIGALVPPDSVMPGIVAAGRPGSVIIRGNGLSNVTSVTLGGVAATVTQASGTEVRVTHPALTAGVKPVQLNGGSVLFQGSVTVVDAPSLPLSSTVRYSDLALAESSHVTSLLYDAARGAIIVVAALNDGAPNEIRRFTYDGSSWHVTVRSVPGLWDVKLSSDQSRLIGAADAGALELDPVTLQTIRTVPAPRRVQTQWLLQMMGVALTNDGRAFMATRGQGLHGYSPILSYAIQPGTFNEMSQMMIASDGPPIMTASADGSRFFLMQSKPFEQPIIYYDAANTRVVTSSVQANGYEQPTAISRDASKVIFHSVVRTAATVYDQSLAIAGHIRFWGQWMMMNPDGTRAYGLGDMSSPGSYKLTTYDLSANVAGGDYPLIGSEVPVTLPASYSTMSIGNLLSAITPDGSVLIFATNHGLRLMAAPN